MSRQFISLVVFSWIAAHSAPCQSSQGYPVGNAFPLQLYSLQPDADIPLVAPDGWNVGHRYGWADGGTGTGTLNALLQNLAQSGMSGMPALPATGTVSSGRTEWMEGDIANWIQDIAPNSNLAFWDFPEELRYWMPAEYQIVQDYAAWTRTYDPLQRPNFMYIPSHYTQDQIQNYVAFLDIIPASAYADNAGQPHAWIRWRMEETIRAINQAGAVIGSDYLNGQKTPVGIVGLFSGANGVLPTPDQTYHDCWQLVASGAQGILVFSYFHRNDQNGALLPNWQRLRDFASEISGPEQLGQMILYGQPAAPVTFAILDGPAQTVAFTPAGYSTPVQFPSIHVFCQQWNGNNYLIAVNSTDQTVAAQFGNLPAGADSATVLFESREVSITDSGLVDSFPAWGVHIYRF